MKISTIAKLSAAPLALSVALISAPAYAQDNCDPGSDETCEPAMEPAESTDMIVVTGSRIARRNVETAAPVAVVQDEEFELSGTINVENVVNTLPQVVPGFTSNSNNPGTGTATLNLRGLGSARTLVLVNGRRWMFYDTSQVVDLNTIPSFLLDSVDVVTGGASAVYGSDALAGVVNFRLREVEGFEVGGQVAGTQEADGFEYELHGAFGTDFADGKGNVTAYAEYFKRESVFQGDRAFSNFALGGETSSAPLQQFGSSTLPNGVIRYFGDGDTTGTDFAPNAAVVFDNVPGDFRTRTGDLYNYAPANYLQIPQERFLFGGSANYEWNDAGHEVYGEISFVNNRVATELAATPVTGTFTVDLATIQPFLNAGDFNQLVQIDASEPGAAGGDGALDLFLQRRVVETGSRNSQDERNAYRVLGGLRGPIGDYLNYDAYYMFARTRNSNIQAGNISAAAFQAGLDGTAPAINIFGPGTLTTAMVDQISILAQNGDESSIEVGQASINGTLGDFAIGTAEPVGFAVGGEWRRVASQFIPDTALASGDVIGFNAGQATQGDYTVRELFGELNVPMEFGGVRVELTGAGRYSDYSLDAVGGVWTYAGGIEISPVDGFTLRGQYQHAIRAPNVGELFGGTAIGFPGATDPCSQAEAATNAGLRDICIASGVPAANVGSTAIQLNTQIPALFGGNPDLQEEVSDSWTAGVVLQPSFLPGLTITADYYNIEIDNAISTISLQTSFDLCFRQVQDPTAPACSPFFNANTQRAGNGAYVTAAPPLLGGQNVATLETSGVDLQVNYGTSLPFSFLTDGESDLSLSFLGTWTEKADFIAFPGSTTVTCAGEFGAECGEPTPKWKWTSRASWIDGPLTTSLRWRHLSAVDDDDPTVDYAAFNGSERIPAYDIFDLTFSTEIQERYTVSLGVNNLFNNLPMTPTFNGIIVSNQNDGTLLGDNQEQANTYPSTYDVLGRRFFLSFDAKF